MQLQNWLFFPNLTIFSMQLLFTRSQSQNSLWSQSCSFTPLQVIYFLFSKLACVYVDQFVFTCTIYRNLTQDKFPIKLHILLLDEGWGNGMANSHLDLDGYTCTTLIYGSYFCLRLYFAFIVTDWYYSFSLIHICSDFTKRSFLFWLYYWQDISTE